MPTYEVCFNLNPKCSNIKIAVIARDEEDAIKNAKYRIPPSWYKAIKSVKISKEP